MILRYPTSNVFGLSITLQQNFFGLEFYDEEVSQRFLKKHHFCVQDRKKADKILRQHAKDDDNETSIPTEVLQQHISNMKMVKMVSYRAGRTDWNLLTRAATVVSVLFPNFYFFTLQKQGKKLKCAKARALNFTGNKDPGVVSTDKTPKLSICFRHFIAIFSH